MLKVTICVGSSCAVRGSDELASALERLIEREKLQQKIELVGAFCMDACSTGVSLRVGDTQYREIHPEDAEVFFYNEIWPLAAGDNSEATE